MRMVGGLGSEFGDQVEPQTTNVWSGREHLEALGELRLLGRGDEE
jgi:hypothetical protein